MNRIIIAAVALVSLCAISRADRVKLKDGTVIEGTVIKQNSGYWVKPPDGEARTIPFEDVASVEATPKPAAQPGKTTPGASGKPTVTYAATYAKAATVEKPTAAVMLWQQFIDSAAADDPNLPRAKTELAKWKALQDGNAERIKGRWVGGEERRLLLDKVKKLSDEAKQLIEQQQTLAAVKKLEEAATAYPNDFDMDFSLGYLYTIQSLSPADGSEKSAERAMQWLNEALRLDPSSSDAVANEGLVCFVARKQYEKGLGLLHKSLTMQDRAEVVQDLVTALAVAPPDVQRSKEARDAKEALPLLTTKYRIERPARQYYVVFQRPRVAHSGSGEEPPPGALWSGTGFVVRDDGLILTNRHVAKGAKAFTVTFENAEGKKTERSAEVVAIDDAQDLALIKVKTVTKLPIIQLSPNDSPADGAECTVMGYPLLDRLGSSVKITRGIVSSSSQNTEGADVLVDAKVNPGNSGGPMLDKHGNVMAIVCMKTLATESEDTYGMGISAGKIRTFLAKNHVSLTSGQTSGASLSAEEIAAKAKPATVCIMATK